MNLFFKNQLLRKKASRFRKGRMWIRNNPFCVSSCYSKLSYEHSVAGTSNKKHPYSFLSLFPPGKEGDRARTYCCLKIQNKQLRNILRKNRPKPPHPKPGPHPVPDPCAGKDLFLLKGSLLKTTKGSLTRVPIEGGSPETIPLPDWGNFPNHKFMCCENNYIYLRGGTGTGTGIPEPGPYGIYRSGDRGVTWELYLEQGKYADSMEYPMVCCGSHVYSLSKIDFGEKELYKDDKLWMTGDNLPNADNWISACCDGSLYFSSYDGGSINGGPVGSLVNGTTGKTINQGDKNYAPVGCFGGKLTLVDRSSNLYSFISQNFVPLGELPGNASINGDEYRKPFVWCGGKLYALITFVGEGDDPKKINIMYTSTGETGSWKIVETVIASGHNYETVAFNGCCGGSVFYTVNPDTDPTRLMRVGEDGIPVEVNVGELNKTSFNIISCCC